MRKLQIFLGFEFTGLGRFDKTVRRGRRERGVSCTGGEKEKDEKQKCFHFFRFLNFPSFFCFSNFFLCSCIETLVT